ncbi:MAG: YgfZ/GcvT domain-containing protein [Polyangia bacterium]
MTTRDLDLLARDAVLAPDAGRQLIAAGGADRVRFLHGLVTNDVAGTPVGQGCRAALLTPKGQVVADLRICIRPDDVRIIVDRGQAPPVAEALSRYAIMDDFTAAPVADFAFLSILGPAAAEKLGSAGVPVGALAAARARDLPHADVGEFWVVRARELGTDGFWVGAPEATLAALRARLNSAGVAVLDDGAAEAARIDALEPRFGVEITADYFPMEVGLAETIDERKGCYLGQEPIVRIRDRGHINWRLVVLDVAGASVPRPGDPLESDTKPKAGRLTSAAQFPDGRVVALAMAHVSQAVGASLRVRPADGAPPIDARIRAEVPSRPIRS